MGDQDGPEACARKKELLGKITALAAQYREVAEMLIRLEYSEDLMQSARTVHAEWSAVKDELEVHEREHSC